MFVVFSELKFTQHLSILICIALNEHSSRFIRAYFVLRDYVPFEFSRAYTQANRRRSPYIFRKRKRKLNIRLYGDITISFFVWKIRECFLSTFLPIRNANEYKRVKKVLKKVDLSTYKRKLIIKCLVVFSWMSQWLVTGTSF